MFPMTILENHSNKIPLFYIFVSVDNDDEIETDDFHHFDQGSGDWNYPDYNYPDDTDDTDYGPESEDQTEPPLFITEETNLYKNPPPPPRGNKDDFGFVEDNNHLDHHSTSFRNSINNNAKSSHNSKSATSQQMHYWLFSMYACQGYL